MASDLIVILCTAPDEEVARTLSEGLVQAGLAACVNAVPRVTSTYRWQGKIERETEVQLLIKTRPERFDEVADWLGANHPYDVPEVVAIDAERVSDAYLSWVREHS